MTVSVLQSSQLDFAKHSALLQAAFQEVLKGTGEEGTLSEEFFRWKYSGPVAPARIAVVEEGGRMLAANSMFAFDIVSGEERVRAWQSGDTATHPDARGKGPVGAGSKRAFNRIQPLSEFGADYDLFFQSFRRGRPPMIERTAALMNWRYFKHPVARYEAFACIDGGSFQGCIVLRAVNISGRQCALILDFMASSDSVQRLLLSFAAHWAREKSLWPCFCFTTSLGFAQALRSGFIAVPQRVLPKRQALLGKASGEIATRIFHQSWHLQIGDWDGL
jgi:hypothetical protein